ncbi:MAG: hypothetical protein J5529_11230 [Prevotella sp.]|nr:hypothetical protein [Prevotella sp.]
MTYVAIVVIALLVLGIVAAAAHLLSHGSSTPVTIQPTCDSCDGSDSSCEQECMLKAAVKEVEYFDDEELDVFQGRAGDSYTDEETESFREVLYTMRPQEVPAWSRSLILRGITIPDQLRDELLMLVEEGR